MDMIDDTLSEDEQSAFRDYKISSYALNNHLLSVIPPTEFLDQIALLDGIVTQDSNSDTVTLYRATQELLLLSRISDNFLSYPSFMSTCTSVDKLERHFSGVFLSRPTVLKIHCPPGTNMVSWDADIFGIPEDEILLGRNHRFIVNSNQVTKDRRVIEHYMGRFYAQGVDNFRILEVTIFD